MKRLIHLLVWPALAALLPCSSGAQELSYDGNRWVQVEISVFTNSPIGGPDAEINRPENARLEYLPRLRRLSPAIAPYLIDFQRNAAGPTAGTNDARPEARATTATPLDARGAPRNPAAPEAPAYGPRYSPPAGDFRLPDYSRDPFIALGPDQREFGRHNTRLRDSPNHRLLYHTAWRQPVLSPAQANAVFVRAGDRFGAHNELEGSLRLSLGGSRVDLQADLWLNSFTPATRGLSSAWDVPEQPFEGDGDDPLAAINLINFEIDEVARLRQERSLREGELHYLDHPSFGVLVRIRPYVLPDPFAED